MNKMLFFTDNVSIKIDTDDWLTGIRYEKPLECYADTKGLLSIGFLCFSLQIAI